MAQAGADCEGHQRGLQTHTQQDGWEEMEQAAPGQVQPWAGGSGKGEPESVTC